MLDVGQRVALLGRRQRPARPVVLLAVLAEGDAQLGGGHRGQPDLGEAEDARRDHGVEQAGEGEAEVALQRRHVVVRAVEHLGHRGIGEERRRGATRSAPARGSIRTAWPVSEASWMRQTFSRWWCRLSDSVSRASARAPRSAAASSGDLGGGADPGRHSRGPASAARRPWLPARALPSRRGSSPPGRGRLRAAAPPRGRSAGGTSGSRP